MQDEKVTFETAKLAREKGFDLPVSSSFIETIKNNNKIVQTYLDKLKNYNKHNGELKNPIGYRNEEHVLIVSRPTQTSLKRWLREVHNIYVDVFNNHSNKMDFEGNFYPIFDYDLILSLDNKLKPKWLFRTYEEALEFGLQEGLKLIE